MKQVTFARPMAPFGVGDKRLVPDAVAAQLQADGAVSASEPWPAGSVSAPAPAKPARSILKPERPIGASAARVAK